MSRCSSPLPEFPGFSAETGQPITDDAEPCYMVVVHLAGHGHDQIRIFVTPNRRKAPFPKPTEDPVRICWVLSHQALGWGDDGIMMKSGWDPDWGMPTPDGDRYELSVQSGPQNKVKYPYALNLTVDGHGIPTIDPEIEYDDDF